jgi:hypothetical protein
VISRPRPGSGDSPRPLFLTRERVGLCFIQSTNSELVLGGKIEVPPTLRAREDLDVAAKLDVLRRAANDGVVDRDRDLLRIASLVPKFHPLKRHPEFFDRLGNQRSPLIADVPKLRRRHLDDDRSGVDAREARRLEPRIERVRVNSPFEFPEDRDPWVCQSIQELRERRIGREYSRWLRRSGRVVVRRLLMLRDPPVRAPEIGLSVLVERGLEVLREMDHVSRGRLTRGLVE